VPGGGLVEPPAVTAARWACAAAGVVAAASAFLPWARASLADRGADLLVVSRTGWDDGVAGAVTAFVGVAAVAACLASAWRPGLRVLAAGLPAAGVALCALAVVRLGAGEPLADKLATLRIGTFQTDAPVTDASAGAGLWLCLGAGLVLIAGGLAWVLIDRRSGRRGSGGLGAASSTRYDEV
jgi:hypothetical protein